MRPLPKNLVNLKKGEVHLNFQSGLRPDFRVYGISQGARIVAEV